MPNLIERFMMRSCWRGRCVENSGHGTVRKVQEIYRKPSGIANDGTKAFSCIMQKFSYIRSSAVRAATLCLPGRVCGAARGRRKRNLESCRQKIEGHEIGFRRSQMDSKSNQAVRTAGSGLKKKVLSLLGAAIVAAVVSGCYAPGLTPRETGTLAGGALGAGGGALIGSTMGAPGTGAILGGVGGALGGYLIGNHIQQQSYYRYPYYY
jgi:osmotically inducible lipoprotein OsmB